MSAIPKEIPAEFVKLMPDDELADLQADVLECYHFNEPLASKMHADTTVLELLGHIAALRAHPTPTATPAAGEKAI